MSAFGRFAKHIKGIAQKLEDRSERRAAELVAAIVDGLDESDVMKGITEDIARGIAENYELVISEIRIGLRPKAGS